MKDSCVGPVGAVGLLLALLLKYQALLNIDQKLKLPALLLFPAVARFGQVLMAVGAKSARDSGLGSSFISGTGSSQLLFSLATILAASYLCLEWKGIVVVAFISTVTFFVRLYFQRRLGGITGDIIGFSNELNEIVCLLLILACCCRI